MKYNYKIFLFILLIISIIIFNSFTKSKEGFENINEKWSSDLIQRFINYQTTVNLNDHQFDLDILQSQASPEEAETLLRTGFWPWPNDLKYEYMDKVWQNPIIKISPQVALDYAMKLYNKNAVTQLLSWNSKEGHFLLYGANIGSNNSLKCFQGKDGFQMKKQVYKGMNFWNGYTNSEIIDVSPEDIPKEMSGFSFVGKSCDPCVVLNSPPTYNCPFKLNIKGDDSISFPWKRLWNL